MAMHTWDELLARWESERLTIEQVIGQLLQHEQQSQTALHASQRRQDTLEQALAALSIRVSGWNGDRDSPFREGEFAEIIGESSPSRKDFTIDRFWLFFAPLRLRVSALSFCRA